MCAAASASPGPKESGSVAEFDAVVPAASPLGEGVFAAGAGSGDESVFEQPGKRRNPEAAARPRRTASASVSARRGRTTGAFMDGTRGAKRLPSRQAVVRKRLGPHAPLGRDAPPRAVTERPRTPGSTDPTARTWHGDSV